MFVDAHGLHEQVRDARMLFSQCHPISFSVLLFMTRADYLWLLSDDTYGLTTAISPGQKTSLIFN